MTEEQLWREAVTQKDPAVSKNYLVWLQLCRTKPKDYPRTEDGWKAFMDRLAEEAK